MTTSRKEVIYKLPLTQFPEDCDWPVQPLATTADVLGGGTPDTGVVEYWEPGEIPWATPTDITGTDGNEITNTERSISTAGLKQSTLIPENSVLMTSRATIGAAKINRVPMAINQGFAAFVPKPGYSSEYLFHLIEVLKPTLVRLGAGTTFLETSRREIKKVLARVPEEDEQHRIAAALKLADDAIAEAKAELEAIRELKRSFAHKALESGLGSSELIDSKFWCYPKTWDLVCVKHLLSGMDAGSSPMCESDPAKPGHWGVLKVSAVSWDRFEEMENKALPATIEPELNAEVKVGDIIVSRANTTELCGAVHRVQSLYTRLLLCDKTWRLHPEKDVNPDWLAAVLKHPQARRQIEANATGTSDSMKNIGKRDFRNVFVPKPSGEEQDKIAEALIAFDANIEAHVKQVEALLQVKKTLLQNLLTGNIRIPEGALNV